MLQEKNPQHISQLPDNNPDRFLFNYETDFDPTFNPIYYPSNDLGSDSYPNQSLYSDWFPGDQVDVPHYHQLKVVVILRNVVQVHIQRIIDIILYSVYCTFNNERVWIYRTNNPPGEHPLNYVHYSKGNPPPWHHVTLNAITKLSQMVTSNSMSI